MELLLETIILLIILGFIAGCISSMCGIGGGVFFVSIMTLILVIPIQIAIDTSNFIILISTSVGFFTYLKQKRLDLKQVLTFSIFTILGSLSCMIFLLFVEFESYILKILFATVLLIAGINMIYKAVTSKIKDNKNNNNEENEDKNFNLKNFDYKAKLLKASPLFFISGFISYLLGIGGGIIGTPALHIVLGYPIHYATGTSTGIIFFTAIFSTILKVFFGKIDYIIGIFIGIGAIIGQFFGAKFSKKMPKTILQLLVAIVLIFLAIRMFF